MTKPLLSICIPTYNRAEYLKQSLESLVVQNKFSEIEVVISDNCSTDNTEEICLEFQKNFPNIKYFRNEENIRDKNFPLSLSRANGTFRKLCNDTIIYMEGTLEYILDIVSVNQKEVPLLFFLNGSGKLPEESVVCSTFDELVYSTSYFTTWIGGFGIWESDLKNIDDEFELCNTQLWQTYKFFSCFERNQKALISNKKIFESLSVKKKDISYGIVKIFYNNFLHILNTYLNYGKISQQTFEWQKKELLFNFFTEYILNSELKSDSYSFGTENIKALVLKNYENETYITEYRKFYKNEFRKRLRCLKKEKIKSRLSSFLIFKIMFYLKHKIFETN